MSPVPDREVPPGDVWRGLINTGYSTSSSSSASGHGGKFFDPETMKATVNSDAGVEALTELVEPTTCMSPGTRPGAWESLSALNAGEIAMTISWPPLGRWAQGVNIEEQGALLGAEDHGCRQGRLCSVAGRPPELASGYHARGIARQQEQGCSLPLRAVDAFQAESLVNVMKPVGLRDPFRCVALRSPDYQNLWPGAKDYLKVLEGRRCHRLCGLLWIETFKYQDAMSRAVGRRDRRRGSQEPLDAMAAEWDRKSPRRSASSSSSAAYLGSGLSKSSAYP